MLSSKYRKRLAVLVVIILLLLGGVLGVTIAYFQDHTEVIKNTFAPGVLFIDPDTQFTLQEQAVVEAAVGSATKYVLGTGVDNDGFEYTVLPGVKIPKRPYIKVDKLLIEAYLYVVVDTKGAFTRSSNNTQWTSTDGKISWAMASGWTFLKAQGNKAIYYYTAKSSDGKLPAGTYSNINIMQQSDGMSITVASDYNYTNNTNNTKGSAVKFDIDFKAYMCQRGANDVTLTVEQAWEANFKTQVETDFK